MRGVSAVLLWAAVLSAQQTSLTLEAETFIEEHFEAAREAEAAAQLSRAISEYRLILGKYPTAVPEIHHNLGLLLYMQKNYAEAAQSFRAALKLKPGLKGAPLFLGVCYLELNQPKAALPLLESAHRDKPSVETATQLGRALRSLRRLEEANNYFRAALKDAERKDQLLHLLGESYLTLSEKIADSISAKYPESKYDYYIVAKVVDGQQWNQIAAKEYMEVVKRDPMNASLLFPFARWLAALGLNRPAELALQRYRKLMPFDTNARLDSAPLPRKPMADVGITVDYEAELTALPAVAESGAPPLAMFTTEVNDAVKKQLAIDRTGAWQKAVAAIARSQWAQAAELLRTVPPNNTWLKDYLTAASLLYLERAEEAEHTAARAKRFANAVPSVEVLQWDIYRSLSFQYFDQLLTAYPTSAWAHLVKARTLDKQGKREALEEYQAALRTDPALPEIRLAMADHYLSNSQFEEARAQCQAELELNPNSQGAMLRLGKIWVELRAADKAIPLLASALKAQPDEAGAHFDLGRALELQNDLDGALREYLKALELDSSLNRLHYVLARLYRRQGRQDLAAEQFRLFQKQEASAREQQQAKLRKLRESTAQSVAPGAK